MDLEKREGEDLRITHLLGWLVCFLDWYSKQVPREACLRELETEIKGQGGDGGTEEGEARATNLIQSWG